MSEHAELKCAGCGADLRRDEIVMDTEGALCPRCKCYIDDGRGYPLPRVLPMPEWEARWRRSIGE